MTILLITQNTVLKRSPLPSEALPGFQKWALAAETTLSVAAYQRSGSHYKITLGKDRDGQQMAHNGFNTWYAYTGHCCIKDPIVPSTTPSGKALIKHFEGLRLNAYTDESGIWTIGYGTTAGVTPGMQVTAIEAEQLLDRDLRKAEQAVADLVEVELSPNQFSALVSFVYNVGEGAFERSTLLHLINAGMLGDAADQLLRWVKAGDRPLPGLVRRRVAERAMFLGQDWKAIDQ